MSSPTQTVRQDLRHQARTPRMSARVYAPQSKPSQNSQRAKEVLRLSSMVLTESRRWPSQSQRIDPRRRRKRRTSPSQAFLERLKLQNLTGVLDSVTTSGGTHRQVSLRLRKTLSQRRNFKPQKALLAKHQKTEDGLSISVRSSGRASGTETHASQSEAWPHARNSPYLNSSCRTKWSTSSSTSIP